MQTLSDIVYCYPDSNVLINLFDERDAEELNTIERMHTSIREMEFDDEFAFTDYGFGDYCRVHQYLFQDVYPWAGQVRMIDIFKGYSSFCPVDKLLLQADSIFDELKDNNYMKGLDKRDFCRMSAYLLADLDMLHPFREGNGRTERLFVSSVARNAGYDLHINDISSKRFHEAMIMTQQSTSILESLLFRNAEKLPDLYAVVESQPVSETSNFGIIPVFRELLTGFKNKSDKGHDLEI